MARCAVNGATDSGGNETLPFVYQGSSCGNGISSINGASTVLGELPYSTGQGFTDYQALGSYAPDNRTNQGQTRNVYNVGLRHMSLNPSSPSGPCN